MEELDGGLERHREMVLYLIQVYRGKESVICCTHIVATSVEQRQ